MALCEFCQAEIDHPSRRLPEPWFDHDRHEVTGKRLPRLTWELLTILWHRRSRTVSVETLLAMLYANRIDDPPDDATIRVLVSRLRRNLDATPFVITAFWGLGYRLEESVKAPDEAFVLGPAEFSTEKPPRHFRRGEANAGKDKYQLRALEVGQSRVIEGVPLRTLYAITTWAKRRGLGTFTAGKDSAGKLRIWRRQ
jgi:DNA-binding winged helix-turn-helix (wHTH) protein